MHRIRKQFRYEAAHQLESALTRACFECVHGHSYTAELVLVSLGLDEDGMVLDFSALKPFIESVMDKWDHGLLLHEDKRFHFQPLVLAGVLKASKVSFCPENPTAEYMAKTLYYDLRRFLLREVAPTRGTQELPRVDRVRVHETSTGWAEYGEAL